MSKTSPSNIDSYVGHRLKMLRLKMGRSLNEVGELLGVSFQQVQKYEKGTNKISSSNLYILADKLGSSVGYFFDGLQSNCVDGEYSLGEDKNVFVFDTSSNISDNELISLVKSYSKIKDSNVRRAFLDLLKAV